MPLPSFAKQDEIPEAFRSAYIEREGKWVPDDSDVAGLKKSQKTLLDEKKAADAELANWKKVLGDTKPEEVAALLESRRKADDEAARKAGDFDKVLEKRINETKAEYEKRIEALAPFKQKYEDREVDLAIRDAAAKAGIIPEDMKYVIQILKGSRVKLDEKSGKVGVYDADGDLTGLSVEKFFAETFKAEAPKFYQSAGGSGGGANGGGSGGRSTNGQPTDLEDFAQRITTDPAALKLAASGKLPVRVS